MEVSYVNAAPSRSYKKALFITLFAVVGFVACVYVTSTESTEFAYDPLYGTWQQWKNENNKVYGGPEDKVRYNVFKSNLHLVAHHNMKQSSYKLAVNKFADLTQKEFSALHTGARRYNASNANNCPAPSRRLEQVEVADTLDWRTQGRVGPVKDQGQCGSCWAFSTVGALEGLYAKENGKIASFSEQQLVDCSTSYGNYGCNGGWVQNAFQYVIAHGIALEGDYPYKAVDGKCKNVKPAFQPTGCADVPIQSTDALKTALQDGPVSVYVEADQGSFQFYSSGVLDDADCFSEGQIDHAVLAVGYTKNAWIVKNSWASSWGDQGYIYIATETNNSKDGVCGILSTTDTYPTA